MRNKRMILSVSALLTAAVMTVESFGYNYGPGAENYNVVIYGGPAVNNPAYDTGWNSGTGPGYEGSNPSGMIEDDIFSGGPNSDAAKKYLEEEKDAFYVFSTYNGGVWKQMADGTWKLLKEDGQPVSSQWAYVDGKTYLLDLYGIMQTGFKKVNDKWYYFNSTGAMHTGWLLKNGKYYFMNSDGSMAYGWVNSMDKWYYLDRSSGVMVTNAYTPDGRYVNAEGVLVQ